MDKIIHNKVIDINKKKIQLLVKCYSTDRHFSSDCILITDTTRYKNFVIKKVFKCRFSIKINTKVQNTRF